MLTCEEIANKAREIAGVGPINRETYTAIAKAIHPVVARVPYAADRDDKDNLYTLPEWREFQKARRLPATEDWTDMVVHAVITYQWRAVVRKRMRATDDEAEARYESSLLQRGGF